MNDKIYVPKYDSGNCAVLDNLQNGYIRVYQKKPTINTQISYVDYFVDSHYIQRSGVQQFQSYNYNVTCVNDGIVTTDFYYRADFNEILVCFFIISIFIIYLPYKLISRAFGRWLKL